MSSGYRAVQWSPAKRTYDLALAGLVALYLAVFLAATVAARSEITVETALVRAFGTLALLLLHVVLAIGPLTRLDRRFLPLLWNRRHLGVTMFLCALAHGGLALVQFHALGVRSPLVSLLAGTPRPGSLAELPFQPLGAAALVVLFLMAATSHDFWLAQLTAPVWKALHMAVYVAYALVVAHVLLGALQDERATAPAALLLGGALLLFAAHLAAARRERRIDRERRAAEAGGLVEIGSVDEIPEKRAKVVALSGERVAVFRYDGRVSAISNVCQHQNGPLGEGRILDGCVTCPWHGYQYRPEDGASPAPFTEKVPTFRVRVVGRRVFVDPRPLPPGTPVAPARFEPREAAEDATPFFVGYLPLPAALGGFLRRTVAGLAVLFVAVGFLLALSQRPLGAGEYEYGVESELEGLLRLDPVPSIWRVAGDAGSGVGAGAGPVEVVPLVGLGKHGPAAEILALAGHGVRARGSWIRRGPERLFEIARAELLGGDDAARRAVAAETLRAELGSVALRGEIVDLKCWLGVMKPGDATSHRACAILCLRGGTPAGLVARDAAGEAAVLWLVGRDGRALGPELLEVVAEPVEVRGELVRLDGRALLVTDRGSVRRLGASGPIAP